MTFDECKLKIKPAVDKFVESLKKYDIQFSETDGHLNNVVFTYKGKEQRIAHEMFYRWNGRCCMVKTNKKGEDILVPMDDNSFYIWLKMIVLYSFKIETI